MSNPSRAGSSMQHSTRLGVCWIGREIHGCCERYERLYKPLIQGVPSTEKWVTSAKVWVLVNVILTTSTLLIRLWTVQRVTPEAHCLSRPFHTHACCVAYFATKHNSNYKHAENFLCSLKQCYGVPRGYAVTHMKKRVHASSMRVSCWYYSFNERGVAKMHNLLGLKENFSLLLASAIFVREYCNR
jgi:hypothetical protein